MNARKFFKRINRGIVLGIIVILGFVIYVVADTSAFKKNKPNLEQAAENYFEAVSNVAVTPESDRDTKKNDMTEEGKKRLSEEFDKMLDDYWTDSSTDVVSQYYYIDMDSMKSSIDYLLNNDSEIDKASGYVTDWVYKLSNIKVVKAGPDVAVVSYDFDVTAKIVGHNPLVICSSEATGASQMSFTYDNTGKAVTEEYESDVNKLKSYNITGNESMKLKKVDGEWKICGISRNNFNSNISDAEGAE